MSAGAVIDRFYTALANGDLAALRCCLSPDAIVWHCFDQVEMDAAALVAALQNLIAAMPERGIEDVRRHAIPFGFVQTHLFVAWTAEGVRMVWPTCILVQVRDGLISRIDEYIDRSGHVTSGSNH